MTITPEKIGLRSESEWPFEVIADDAGKIYVEYKDSKGKLKSAYLPILMADILKEHLQVIKSSTESEPNVLAFYLFDDDLKEKMKKLGHTEDEVAEAIERAKSLIKEACDLINIEGFFVDIV